MNGISAHAQKRPSRGRLLLTALLLAVLFIGGTVLAVGGQEATPFPHVQVVNREVQLDPELAGRQSGECVDIPSDVDVTIPDQTPLKEGTKQTKTWRLTNCGITTWSNYKIRYLTSNGTEEHWLAANPDLQGPANLAAVPETKPGESAEVSITFTVPKKGTSYVISFMMENEGGLAFRKIFWVWFVATD